MKDIAQIFHQLTRSKYQRGMKGSKNSKELPPEWKTVYFKEYPRLPKILLFKPRALKFFLDQSVIGRKSEREFNGEPVSLLDLSQLLFYSAGIIEKGKNDWNKSRRAYPSAGARFPLEIYLINFIDAEKIKEGIYHYDVKGHSLEKLFGEDLREEVYPQIVWQEMIFKAPMLLAISAVFNRNMMKYRERGYRYVLFEAGHLGQNIYLISAALGLKCCAVGGFDDDKLNKLLDIDSEEEAAIYLFAIGH